MPCCSVPYLSKHGKLDLRRGQRTLQPRYQRELRRFRPRVLLWRRRRLWSRGGRKARHDSRLDAIPMRILPIRINREARDGAHNQYHRDEHRFRDLFTSIRIPVSIH